MAETKGLSRANVEVKALLRATFPDYRGRTIRLVRADRYFMEDYWDGGTRSYVKAYQLGTGAVAMPAKAAQNPFSRAAHSDFEIPDGVAMVEHTFFCGKDMGIRVHVNGKTYDRLPTDLLLLLQADIPPARVTVSGPNNVTGIGDL